MTQTKFSPLYSAIYNLVRQVPPGYVTTYGQIAQLVGCTARTVGFSMAALPFGSDVPWQRVINSQGKISPRTDGEGNILQRDLLEAEGLGFDQKGQVNLNEYGWIFWDNRTRK
ncbi:MAG: cysteine methyltransferase [Desulfuromusa sp.]|nr:cysteine methyltransferase [Desulfuromusa sp.]